MATIPSQHAMWLALSERDGRGGLSLPAPSIVRSRSRAMRLQLEEHQVFGDWTDGSFVCKLKSSPDAPDPALAEWTAETGTPSGGITTVTFTLLPENQVDLPADTGFKGAVEVLLQVDFVPTEGEAYPVWQTNQFVAGTL